MADALSFELVSPERLLLSVDAAMVVVPGTDGNLGILPGHIPLISTLRPGVIDVYQQRPEIADRVFVAGGFCEITPDRCTVLAETATPVADLDAAAAAARIADLTEDLQDAKDDAERAAVERALLVARAEHAAATHIL